MAFWDKFKKKQKYRYVSEGHYGQPYWTTQKDKQFITEAYNKVVWVYSCVMQISSATSSVPWLLYRKGRAGRHIEIEQHPILDMLNNSANSFMSSRDFIDLWATYLALEGKFYAEYVNPALPTQLVPLYPHYMKPIPSKEQFVSGYKYDNYGTIYYDKEEVLWSRFNDPLDVYEGLSPIRALSRTIDTENEAVNWNKSTLQNSGVPAGLLTIQNAFPELIDNLRDEWKRRYGGGNNARTPLVIDADRATYQPIGLSSVDMDFLSQRKLNRTEICSAFGVPSQLVGDPEGQTYSNFNEAVKSFWENTIIPRYLEHMKQKLQSDLLPRYADNLMIAYDLSKVSGLKESQESLVKRTIELWQSSIITQNEARFALDYTEIPTGNVFYNQIPQRPFVTQDTTTGDASNEVLPSEGEQKSLDAKKNCSNSLSDNAIHFMIE